jgi:ribonuclease P protein component
VVPTTDGKERLGLIARAERAVDRNRIKRRLRSAYDRCEVGGIDAVVTGDNSVAKMPFDTLVETVGGAVQTARRGLK